MKYAKVTAVVRAELLTPIEQRMVSEGVSGMSVTEVRGFGELKDFFKQDLLTRHVRIEIFTLAERADTLARAIMQEAGTGESGDGIVAVLPAQQVYRIRTRAALEAPQPRNDTD